MYEAHTFCIYIHHITNSASFGLYLAKTNETVMPLFRITVKSRINTNGVRLEPGMSVDVVSNRFDDPVHTNGGQSVVDAFMRIYGVDIKRTGALSSAYLKVERIG